MKEKDYLGKLVRSTAGHDQGSIYLIVSEDPQAAYAADGKRRSCTAPKKKSKKHLQALEHALPAVEELAQRLRRGEAVREEEIRKLIRSYEREYDICQKQTSLKSKEQ
ncbi:MAG: KOW domain-containing RNA-binding protein [Lachnospiraceae bacterium]|nr:KOW domain-containing RNA-binding protein [Lachnospiraceae bacterium]